MNKLSVRKWCLRTALTVCAAGTRGSAPRHTGPSDPPRRRRPHSANCCPLPRCCCCWYPLDIFDHLFAYNHKIDFKQIEIVVGWPFVADCLRCTMACTVHSHNNIIGDTGAFSITAQPCDSTANLNFFVAAQCILFTVA